ncbi:hypothetical protein [Actinomadura sp. 21ATH]|uniref:hypothetical protein n=1 Tax=Actinomadura sp. 21ATH TaxID=1735444 RepID=UPI0035C244C9
MSDDPGRAAQCVLDALRRAPAGAEGSVRRIALASACPAEYRDLGEVARARRAANGDVVWWAFDMPAGMRGRLFPESAARPVP